MPSAVLSQSADELPDVLHFLAAAPALPFHFISLHAPSKGRRLREKQLVAMLLEVVRSVDAVVVHPDTIDDPARYAALGSALVLENMDARKRDGRTVAELEPYFAALPHAEDRKPGTQEIFGAAASAGVLARRIGLDEDTNRSLTRRMLLLLESVPVAGDDAYERCWVHVLNSYLEDATKDFRPPRFLLNDLVRHWRTICVDYVGKQREDEETWGAAQRRVAHGAQGALRGGAAADPALRPSPAGRDARLPRRAAARNRPPIAWPRRSRPTTSGTAVDALWTPTTAGSGCSATTPRGPSWPPCGARRRMRRRRTRPCGGPGVSSRQGSWRCCSRHRWWYSCASTVASEMAERRAILRSRPSLSQGAISWWR